MQIEHDDLIKYNSKYIDIILGTYAEIQVRNDSLYFKKNEYVFKNLFSH